MPLSMTGKMVGPHSGATTRAAATVANIGEGWDFAIGGLPFHLHVSDATPYERATAQFRKDQLDTSNQAGDQSLIGYWTRGQFSFHRGAGIDYYEPTEADEVLSRFKEGSGVEPFTAGEVTLGAPLNSSPMQDVKYLGRTFDFTNGAYLIALLTDGTLVAVDEDAYGGAATVIPFGGAGAGPGKTLTPSPNKAFIARGTEVHSYSSAAATTTVLWTLPAQVYGAFYAKTRLWIVDENGRWYMASTAGGTLLAADSVFTIPDRAWLQHTTDGWSVCETPRSVLFAYDNEIYRVAVDLSTATPTVTQPELVASLPTNEIISHIDYHLGRVAICTGKGVRFALEDADGRLTYGPLVATGVDFSSVNAISSDGSSIVIPGQGDGGFGMYHFSVANEVSDLVPGWVLRDPMPAVVTAPDYSGAYSSFLGTLAWANTSTNIYRTALAGAVAQSGTLTTGLHRFGTMEPKKFHSVRVRVGGDGGTVLVSKVLESGAIVPLHTIDVTTTSSEEITLGMSDPTEMVGLHFTLTRASLFVGPKLMGYQLRALPAPKRQRLIRVPLALYDVERRGSTPAKGRTGAAYDRLRALEDMEESGGTFIFQDFRTGEAGQCFIESVEHKGVAPPGRQSDGYGGVVFVTLRKL